MYSYIIVDDEPIIRKGTFLKIEKANLNLKFCGEAGNGEEALALIKNTHPDIIIMDMKMPIMDGRVLLDELKKSCPKIKIVVMSGYSDYEYMRDAINANAVDYILKPFNAKEMSDVLTKVISTLEEKATRHIIEFIISNNLIRDIQNGNSLEFIDNLNYFFNSLKQKSDMDISRFNNDCLCLFNYIIDIIYANLNENYKKKIEGKSQINLSVNNINESERIITAKLIDICHILSENHNQSSKDIVNRVKRYVLTNYTKNLSLERIAIAFSISPNYFSFLFKKENGYNFIDFVNRVRIQKAKELLLNTNHKTNEIAKLLGFNNTKYFYRVFKNLEGCTPSEFKTSTK